MVHACVAGAGVNPGTHAPPAQMSPRVHALPSSHGPVLGTCRHVPVASQTSSVQPFPSLVHVVPGGASWQRAEQQSPSPALPSSQVSRGSRTPFPHLVPKRETLQILVLEVHVLWVSSPSPVPVHAKSAQSPGIAPVMENAPVSGSTVPVRVPVEPMEQETLTCRTVPVCTSVSLQGIGIETT